MENYISYVAGGEKQTVTTPLCFEDGIADYVIARKVLVAILGDLKNKIDEQVIRTELTAEEVRSMTEEEIVEWGKVTCIEFVDNVSKKKLLMRHMSDVSGNFTTETF